MVVKKEDNPRKGRKFWKCVLRHCDYFEWENEMDATSEGKKPDIAVAVEVNAVTRLLGVVPAAIGPASAAASLAGVLVLGWHWRSSSSPPPGG